MTFHDSNLIARLAGYFPLPQGSRILASRKALFDDMDAAYRTLFHPKWPGDLSLAERRALGAFVSLLQGEEASSAHYLQLLAGSHTLLADIGPLLWIEAAGASMPGPYGRFPAGPLSLEDIDGPEYRVSESLRARISPRLAAALEHAHLMATHPRDASSQALDRLRAAGLNDGAIVLLSQLVGFLAFQVRVIVGLRSLVLHRQVNNAVAAE